MDITIDAALDLSKPNQLLAKRFASEFGKKKTAGIRWEYKFKPYPDKSQIFEARLSTLKHIYAKIKMLDSYSFWILAGTDTSWRPDRIEDKVWDYKVRKYGIWNFLEEDCCIKNTEQTEETIVVKDEETYAFGSKLLSESSLPSVARFVSCRKNCFFLIGSNQLEIKRLLNKGWKPRQVINLDLVKFAIENAAFVIQPYGEFDDIDYGLLGAGDQSLAMQLQ